MLSERHKIKDEGTFRKMWLGGKSRYEIADFFGVDESTVRSTAAKLGMPRPQGGQRRGVPNRETLERDRMTCTVTQLAEKYHVDVRTVQRHLKMHGITKAHKVRPRNWGADNFKPLQPWPADLDYSGENVAVPVRSPVYVPHGAISAVVR